MCVSIVRYVVCVRQERLYKSQGVENSSATPRCNPFGCRLYTHQHPHAILRRNKPKRKLQEVQNASDAATQKTEIMYSLLDTMDFDGKRGIKVFDTVVFLTKPSPNLLTARHQDQIWLPAEEKQPP